MNKYYPLQYLKFFRDFLSEMLATLTVSTNAEILYYNNMQLISLPTFFKVDNWCRTISSLKNQKKLANISAVIKAKDGLAITNDVPVNVIVLLVMLLAGNVEIGEVAIDGDENDGDDDEDCAFKFVMFDIVGGPTAIAGPYAGTGGE